MPEPQRLEEPLDSFVREIALCVATNGDKGPALFWPENSDTLPELQRLARSVCPPDGWPAAVGNPGFRAAGTGPARVKGLLPQSATIGPKAELLAATIGDVLGLPVRASYRFLPSAAIGARQASGAAEYVVTVLNGACRCRVTRDGNASAGPGRGAVDLRLRGGGTLFVPRNHAYDLLDVHTPTVLMELVLGDPG
ncbi:MULTISPECIES: hypothetical protein [unclassified Streptomyces]|uniref:hypothetical protein n=1 Tax=unclassified Streptomyces TaxID=2593676 RepID=UPI000DB95985|nr:hypothetical protein [Streptomyces sp. PsTaAH-137]MYT68229.1 hypothetical protein [Streptomyces sp. SID8367]RAJ76861.1 hypothetical protein K377_06029 [Streptomyces sp. PsTaAH-137]